MSKQIHDSINLSTSCVSCRGRDQNFTIFSYFIYGTVNAPHLIQKKIRFQSFIDTCILAVTDSATVIDMISKFSLSSTICRHMLSNCPKQPTIYHKKLGVVTIKWQKILVKNRYTSEGNSQ